MNQAAIVEVIAARAREVVPALEGHIFQAGDRLEDLGANSLDRAEIVTLVLEFLQLRISRVEAFGPTSIGELSELLYRKMNET